MSDAQSYDELAAIRRRLKRSDYAGLVAVKRLPAAQQRAQLWLNGFLLDVREIPFKVDEPLLGEIRLQWWRDSLLKLQRGERIGHPVADGLGPLLQDGGDELVGALTDITGSYGAEVQKTPVATVTEFETRMQQRWGGFFKAAFLLAGCDAGARHTLLQKAGLAVGTVEVVASLPRTMASGMALLPDELLSDVGLSYEDIAAGRNKDRLLKLFDQLGGLAGVSSWDIKPLLAGMPALERKLLARFILVPRVYRQAVSDRLSGRAHVSQLNPLAVVFALALLRP